MVAGSLKKVRDTEAAGGIHPDDADGTTPKPTPKATPKKRKGAGGEDGTPAKKGRGGKGNGESVLDHSFRYKF